MAQRISLAQMRSKLQQIQSRQRQAINNYNQAVRQHNQKISSAIAKYNGALRAHNNQVRANRQRVLQALSALPSRTTVTRYVKFRVSVDTLHQSYVRLDQAFAFEQSEPQQDELLDLSERENANSLEVMNALLAEDAGAEGDLSRLQETRIGSEIHEISEDLNRRWKGALFALHPRNPDAARHFCTSAREIFTSILEHRAPDEVVKQALPGCPLTESGRPTRRSRIQFALARKGLPQVALKDFVQQDIDNILDLFDVFNDGTHGSAGRFDFRRLLVIKNRVEDGLLFLCRVFA
jgi:hypothetical protein